MIIGRRKSLANVEINVVRSLWLAYAVVANIVFHRALPVLPSDTKILGIQLKAGIERLRQAAHKYGAVYLAGISCSIDRVFVAQPVSAGSETQHFVANFVIHVYANAIQPEVVDPNTGVSVPPMSPGPYYKAYNHTLPQALRVQEPDYVIRVKKIA